MLKVLWRVFVDGVIDNEEKVAASKKNTKFKTRVRKPCPALDQLQVFSVTPVKIDQIKIKTVQ